MSEPAPDVSKNINKCDVGKNINIRSSNNQLTREANSSRYKTELCRPFEENGTCKYGDKCQLAHGASELRNLQRHPKYKTELCRTFHSQGLCSYGPRCHFFHNNDAIPIPNLIQSLQGLQQQQ